MSNVLLIGEAMALFTADKVGELVDVSNFTKSMAGAEVNVAIGLKRLGHRSIYVTKLGDEPLGRYIEKSLKEEGVDTSYVIFDEVYKTGIQLKEKAIDKDPYAPYYRLNSAASKLSISDIENIDLNEIDLIHITGILPAISKSCKEAVFYILEKAKTHNIYISFDPNIRPSLWNNKEKMVETLNKIASYANLVLPGIEEGLILTGSKSPEEIASFYHKIGVENVVIKLGKNGAYLSIENTKLVTKEVIEGFIVEKVVDTVGAGDGFATGVISGILDDIGLRASVNRGNAIGAIQVQHISDNAGLPTLEELEKFIIQKKPL